MHRGVLFLILPVVMIFGLGPAQAGEIQGQVLITRALTKKRVSTPVYSMRGISLPAAKESRPVDEMSRTVVYLEGHPSSPSVAPRSATLAQKNKRFDPDLLVIEAGADAKPGELKITIQAALKLNNQDLNVDQTVALKVASNEKANPK